MIKRYIEVECDNCSNVLTFYNFQITDVYTSIRDRQWAVSKDRLFTFCPECKIKVTNVGRNGCNKLLPFCAKKAKFIERERKFQQEEEARMQKMFEEDRLYYEELNR